MPLFQTFAIDADGLVRSVDEVARGLACNCCCPKCGDRLEAKQGSVRRWHFAHAAGADCPGSAETALHLAAKRVLLESRSLAVPKVEIRKSTTLPDGRQGYGLAIREAGPLPYWDAAPEKALGAIRPDVSICTDFGEVLVEIAVTHFVDQEKRAKLTSIGLPAIEISLSRHWESPQAWTWELLRAEILGAIQNKSWLVKLEEERLAREAEEAAILDAESQAPPIARASRLTSGPRSLALPRSFHIGRDRVVVSQKDFGVLVRVTAIGDVTIDPLLLRTIRQLGGKWKAQYRNWIFPSTKLEVLCDRLLSLAKEIDNEPHGQRHKRVLDEYYSEHQFAFPKRDTELGAPALPAPVPVASSSIPSDTKSCPAQEENDLGSARGINERIRARIAAEKARQD